MSVCVCAHETAREGEQAKRAWGVYGQGPGGDTLKHNRQAGREMLMLLLVCWRRKDWRGLVFLFW